MGRWTPDPTFYPSAKTGMDAPREELGYVAILNPNGANRPDALGVLDLDPASSSYEQLVGRDSPEWERAAQLAQPW
jgi:selenium-binding protein 1